MTLCFTVDVEDWFQSSVDFNAQITERCVRNTHRMLDVFDELQVRGTWFVQGLVAERYPEVPREIARRGHEVACHAHTHRPLFAMSDEDLQREIGGARRALEDAIGQRVLGFRAPDFSLGTPCERLDQVNRQIFAILAREGFTYDSSVVPARMSRYGISEAPRGPFRLREGIIEVPLSTVWAGRRLPALGGGYLRLFPTLYHRLALWQADRAGHPSVVYLHPYELDTTEVRERAKQQPIPLRFQVSQHTGRGSNVTRRLKALRGRRTACTLAECVGALEHLPVL